MWARLTKIFASDNQANDKQESNFSAEKTFDYQSQKPGQTVSTSSVIEDEKPTEKVNNEMDSFSIFTGVAYGTHFNDYGTFTTSSSVKKTYSEFDENYESPRVRSR